MMIKKFLKEWKITVIVGFVIVFIAFFLRVYNLNNLPIFADEAIYIRWAQVMRAEPSLRFLPLSDGKQPLFMWSVIPLFKLFSDPLFAGRFLSVLTGAGTLLGVFFTSYVLFKSKKIGIIASLIYALSPFAVFFDRMALVDSMLSMFGIWTFLLAVITAKTKRLDFAMLTGFALGGALLTKSPSLFFVLLLPTTWILSSWPKKREKIILHLLKLVSLSLVTIVIGYAMFNILRLGTNFHLLSNRNYDYVYPYSQVLQSPFSPLFAHLKGIFGYFWLLGPGSLLGLLLIGVFVVAKKYWKETLILGLWGILPILITSEYSKVMTARYILFTVPFLVILSAAAFKARKKHAYYLGIIALILFIFQSLNVDRLLLADIEKTPLPRSERSGYLEEWTSGTGIKEVANYLKTESPNDLDANMVVGTEGYFGTLPDGLQIYLNEYPNIKVIGVGVNLEEVPTSLKESRKAGNKTYLVINNTRLMINNPEEKGLELIAAYPKSVKPNSTRETLFFFEVNNTTVSGNK